MRVLLAVACVLALGLGVSWYVGGELVAPAPRNVGAPPTDLHGVAFTTPSDSGSVLAGWHTSPEQPIGVVVLAHGIRSSRLAMLGRARMLDELGLSTVMIDLQAHGESPGRTIGLGALEMHDVRSAVAFARDRHPGLPVGVIGVSLGGAAALLASPLGIDALVLESVYPSIEEAVRNRVRAQIGPFAALPTALLLAQLKPRLGVDSASLRPIDRLPAIDCPVYIASGAEDFHTTATETRAMYEAAAEPKELWLVEGAAHVDLHRAAPQHYEERIGGFLRRYLH